MRHIEAKICGLTRPQDIETALMHGAKMLGFIIEAQSSRKLSVTAASRLSRPAIGCAQRVAVTVNAPKNLLVNICTKMRPDALQMHGDETPELVRMAKSLTGLPIIKAVQIRTKIDLELARQYEGIADYILLDAKPPKGAAQQGGHGQSFDWGLLKNYHSEAPIILAGGLSPSNIKTAKATGIKFFDVSSGVEAMPGVKDASLIRAFMKAAHE